MKKLFKHFESKKFIGFIISLSTTITLTCFGFIESGALAVIIPALYVAYVSGNALERKFK